MNRHLAYINTDFIVDDPLFNIEQVIINIGKVHPGLDLIINPFNVWCFITAWNPAPKILSVKENISRMRDLKNDVKRLNLAFYEGCGISKDKSWSEDSILIIGISKKESIQLGKKYQQEAIVWGTIGQTAKLIYC